MRFEKIKLFRKMDGASEHVHYLPYDDNIEYYAFLRKCRDNGYKQVIVTSEIMIQILRYVCLKKEQRVYKIEFVEDDEELEKEINILLELMINNKAYLSELLEKLRFLSEKSSIDLKKIYIKGTWDNCNVNYFIQSNGIIGINKESFEKVSEELKNLVEGCLF